MTTQTTKTNAIQTAIECPENRHDYRRGVDETLKRQQLAEIIRVKGTANLGKKRGTPKTKAPLFEAEVKQEFLFP